MAEDSSNAEDGSQKLGVMIESPVISGFGEIMFVLQTEAKKSGQAGGLFPSMQFSCTGPFPSHYASNHSNQAILEQNGAVSLLGQWAAHNTPALLHNAPGQLWTHHWVKGAKLQALELLGQVEGTDGAAHVAIRHAVFAPTPAFSSLRLQNGAVCVCMCVRAEWHSAQGQGTNGVGRPPPSLSSGGPFAWSATVPGHCDAEFGNHCAIWYVKLLQKLLQQFLYHLRKWL